MRLGIWLLAFLLGSCKSSAPAEKFPDAASSAPSATVSAATSASAAPSAQVDAVDAGPQGDALKAVMSATTFADAIKAADPLIDEAPPPVNQPGGGVGTVAITTWAARHLVDKDVFLPENQTTYAIAIKHPVRERGRRFCTSGKIMYFQPKGEGIDQFVHGMLSAKEGMVEYLAVGMRGRLSEGLDARFCGAVISDARYATKQGSGKALTMVGMFDLPENHRDAGK
jgi:hypothetical protein